MEMDVYDELLAAALFIVFSSIVLWVFRKLWAVRKRKNINDTSSKSGHYWSSINYSEQHNYCSGCKEHIVSGYECDNCLLKVDNIILEVDQTIVLQILILRPFKLFV
nr:hypothetical protein F46H6.3 - Caenorhabditis elegans [Caenorhabditis elegans]